ncbi:MAG: hypothetical protein H0Z24_09350 [Thermosipho sp. (in: Bacteria)]|nr:hypothetical protein [Thermosipho sp. (in: thermotogales)]
MGSNKNLFISDAPTTDDQFEIHSKIADQISDFIGDLDEGTTIALKGKWGSGKSSIIEMLKEKGNGKYKVFVFDVWAELGHDFRQAFLLRFLDWIYKEKQSVECYKCKREQILGKKRKIERDVSPKNKGAVLYLFILLVALMLLPLVIKNFVNLIIEKLPWDIGFNLLAFYVIPLTIVEWFYYYTLKELKKVSIEEGTKEKEKEGKEKKKKKKKKKRTWDILKILHIVFVSNYIVWLTISVIDMWFSGWLFSGIPLVYTLMVRFIIVIIYFVLPLVMLWVSKIPKEGSWSVISMFSGLLVGKYVNNETTTLLTSNSLDFEKEFEKLLKENFEEENDKKLVIVIDNVDRIPEEKVDEVFAALKPFMISDEIFNGSKDKETLKNVFYIIPFDPEGIRIETDKGGYDYFNKLFKKEFYVPEPIYGNWQKYFEQISKEAGIDIPTYLIEIAFQIVIGFKDYIEIKKENQNLKSKNTFNNDENVEEHPEDREAFAEIENEIKKIFIPPTPREIKKFLNNYITIFQQYPEIKKLVKKEEREIFPYILFAVLKTYGMINSSSELEKLFIEKTKEDKSIFELYLSEKGYEAYSFKNSKELVYKIYAIYYGKEPRVGFVVLQIPTLRKILAEPSYNEEFNLIISNVPDSFRNIFEDSLKNLIIKITDTIYSKEPQIIVGIGIYLKKLKEQFNEVYKSVKDKLFSILKSNFERTEEFISKLDERIFDGKKSNLLNLIESILFIQKEANFDLINPILEFSKYKVEILEVLIENVKIENKIDLDIGKLKETFYDPERDAPYLIKLLDYIGKNFNKNTDELIKGIISRCIVISENLIDKCLEIFNNIINRDSTIDDYFSQIVVFLKGLGKILTFEKYVDQKEKIQRLVLNKFSSIFSNKILSINNSNRNFIYIQFLLTFYSYFYTAKTRDEIYKLINSFSNNYSRIISSLRQDQNISSILATLFLVYDDIKNVNTSFFDLMFSSADNESIIGFIKEYEIEDLLKTEEIIEIYSYFIEKFPSRKSRIMSIYKGIYKYLLETEEYDLSWIFNLYKLLKDLNVSLDKIKNCVKRLSEEFSFDNAKIDEYNIELLNYLFEIRNEEGLIRNFEEILNKEMDKDVREKLFARPAFYECCANHNIKLAGNLHKIVFKVIFDNLESFSEDDIEKIADFLVIQDDSFIKDFMEDFKRTISDKAHSIDDIESSEEEIDFIFEKFNIIFEKLIQSKRKILEKVIDNEFIRMLENLSTVPENVEKFLGMIKR